MEVSAARVVIGADGTEGKETTYLGGCYLGFVQDAFLHVAAICHLTNHATECIHFVHKLALGGTTHRWIARLPGNTI